MGKEFVGRDEYLTTSMSFLRQLETAGPNDYPRVINFVGPGCIGKTKILQELKNRIQQYEVMASQIIDLQVTNNQTELSLLSAMTSKFDSKDFLEFQKAFEIYNNAHDRQKIIIFDNAVSEFVDALVKLSIIKPVVIFLDTFEVIQKNRPNISQWLTLMISKLGGRVGFVLAGRNPIELNRVFNISFNVSPFSIGETNELAVALYKNRNYEYDLEDSVIQSVHRLSNGHPIIISLAIELILEKGNPLYIINLPSEHFEKELVKEIRSLKDQESLAIMMMAIAERKSNVKILSILLEINIDQCNELIQELKRFSFVKIGSGTDSITLHDEMLRLINNYIDFPEEFKNNKRMILVDGYYEDSIVNSSDTQSKQALIAEKLYYQLFYDKDLAVNLFDSECSRAVSEYNYNFANLLLSEILKHGSELNKLHKDIVNLQQAELALRQYRTKEAKELLESLRGSFPSKDYPELYTRVLEGLGGTIINYSMLPGVKLLDAVKYWEESFEICKKNNIEERIPNILFNLGMTYGSSGHEDKAISYYNDCFELCKKLENMKLAARALDEMGRLYRLQQFVPKAFDVLRESMKIRNEIHDDKNMGMSYYFMANAYRDLANFDKADEYYGIALRMLSDIDDQYNICRLYCDFSWMEFLRGNNDKTEQYTQISQEMAIRGNFGTELSENIHIWYELAMDRGDRKSAYAFLDEALKLAKEYNNVYIILDCSNHVVQRAYALGNFEEIPIVLDEMLKWEECGSSVRVFRGRAMLVYGDYFFDQKKYHDAYTLWKDGFAIVALFGNSRTNVELFGDLFKSREQKIKETIKALGPNVANELRDYWTEKGLEDNFHEMIDICSEI